MKLLSQPPAQTLEIQATVKFIEMNFRSKSLKSILSLTLFPLIWLKYRVMVTYQLPQWPLHVVTTDHLNQKCSSQIIDPDATHTLTYHQVKESDDIETDQSSFRLNLKPQLNNIILTHYNITSGPWFSSVTIIYSLLKVLNPPPVTVWLI